jgi:WD40 repeat protein
LCIGEQNWVCKSTITDGHTRSIRSVAWSFCGTRLASAGFDAKVSIWEREGQEFVLQTTLEGHENEVKDIAFSRSGLYLATCGRDKSVWIWECKHLFIISIKSNFFLCR